MTHTLTSEAGLTQRLKALLPSLTRSEARVAQWIIQNEFSAAMETGASLAAKSGVSEITVGRFLRKLGLPGMQGLRDVLRTDNLAQQVQISDRRKRLGSTGVGAILRAEAEAVLDLARQVDGPGWTEAAAAIGGASVVHVTGFQSIRGLAEDFTRRLALLMPNARFLSVYDGMLAEWLDEGSGQVLILFDITPYARAAEHLVRLAATKGITVVVLTDEMNGWASPLTPYVFHATTKVGAFLESVGTLAALSSMLLHAIAGQDEARTAQRMSEWPSLMRGLNLI